MAQTLAALGLALALAGAARAQVTQISVSQKLVKSGAAVTAEPGFTVRYTLAKPSPVTLTIRRHSATQGERPGTLFPGVVVKTTNLPKQPKGARTYKWAGKLDNGEEVTALVVNPDGTTQRKPVDIFTVEARAGSTPPVSLTFSRATGPDTPRFQLVPQAAGNVFQMGRPMAIGLSVSNPTSAAKKLSVAYDCAVPLGAVVKAAKMTLPVGALERVSVALPLGKPDIAGPLRISATVTDGKPVSLVTAGGTVPQHLSPATAETPFGVAGLAELDVVGSLGARWWLGGWPWAAGAEAPAAVTPAARRTPPALDSPAGFLAEAQRYGLTVGSRLPVESVAAPLDGFSSYLAFMQQVMRAYIRQAGLWQLPLSQGLDAPTYAARLKHFYTVSKAIHKDAPTLMDAGSDLQLAQQLASEGADRYTDALAVRELQLTPSDSGDPLEALIALRDAHYPGKEIWNTSEGYAEQAGSPEDAGALVRSIVRQVAAGVDRVFWSGEPDLVRSDGSPTPAFFAYSTLTYYLGGAEYVGNLEPVEGARLYVFQKKGRPILVAWSEAGVKPVTLPAEASGLQTREPSFMRANFGRVSGSKVTLTTTPIFIEGVQRSIWTEAHKRELGARLARVRELALAAEIRTPALEAADVTEETLSQLYEAGVTRYAEVGGKDTGSVVTYLFHVSRLGDCVAQQAGMTEKATKITTDKALDTANHAIADLRLATSNREGVQGFLRDTRTLLRQAERPNYLARVALKLGDLALASSRARQATLLCRALGGLVPKEEIWYPARELPAEAPSVARELPAEASQAALTPAGPSAAVDAPDAPTAGAKAESL